jgi:peptidoglycan/xylan/chitin deacetylase (PgdA/CDA1 family)
LKTTILCYHKVGDESDEGRWLNVSPETLRRHVAFFYRRNVSSFLPQDFLIRRPSGVCFTFDDAYVSALENASGILEEYGFRGAFYVVPSLVGKASSWDAEKARPLADWALLKSTATKGHEIGNHTFGHVHLGNLDESGQSIQILKAHEVLIHHGFDPKSLCFPYGSFNHLTVDAMAQTGYKIGLKLEKRPVGQASPTALPRIVVGFSDQIAHLLYKIYIRPKLP